MATCTHLDHNRDVTPSSTVISSNEPGQVQLGGDGFRAHNGGGGAGNRTRVRSRVKRNIYECSPGFYLAGASPWDQAPHRPVTVCVAPAAVTPAGAEAAGISVGSGHRSRLTGRRQAVA